MLAVIFPPMGRKILLVEDNTDFREIFGRMACHLGFEVVYAETVVDTILKATSEKPDLIVVDLVLKGTDGLAAIRRLKKKQATRKIPVLVCTALIDERHETAALKAGAVEFLRKPIGVSVFRQTFQKYLN